MFPLLFTVGVHTHTETIQLDEYNEIVSAYVPARGATGTPCQVYGWSTPLSTEPAVAGHDRVVVDVQLMVPPGFPAGPYDVIDLPDGEYQVIGQPEDFNHGPFGWQPGTVLNLRKVTG